MSENETIVVGIVPAKEGLIKVVFSASKSSSLLGAKAACAKNNVVKDVTVPTPKSGAVVVHDDTESILKKGPAAETAPDADAVDSDKTSTERKGEPEIDSVGYGGACCTGVRAGLKQAAGRMQSNFAGAMCAIRMLLGSCASATAASAVSLVSSSPLVAPALVLVLLAIACGASGLLAASGEGARGAASSATATVSVSVAAATACLTGFFASAFSWLTVGPPQVAA
eukprot:CAMPEP_0185415358 /NCGR_PEP_ID=MMETSP1365-20130426/6445_1 /TAXON_ID=38817 /ORGANISM="Gephyrocapsa oceanica, Strain RCC1303" /LENGTH=225 /DNA_ID=CAMNT_0028018453 /DNA_START=109 /DNA_END=782 /DNA_ORIENTATION=-